MVTPVTSHKICDLNSQKFILTCSKRQEKEAHFSLSIDDTTNRIKTCESVIYRQTIANEEYH
jgi:hypothetical protein